MQLQQGKKHRQARHLGGWVMVCVGNYVLPHTFILGSDSSRPQRPAHLNLRNAILNQMRDGTRGKRREMRRKGRKDRKDKTG